MIKLKVDKQEGKLTMQRSMEKKSGMVAEPNLHDFNLCFWTIILIMTWNKNCF
jgi:hypothetical protein